MPMTIRQIIARTPPSRRNAADYVTIKSMKIRKSAGGYPIVLAKTIAKYTNLGDRKNPPPVHQYVTTIELQGRAAIVSCSCDDFRFVWEHALFRQKAAAKEYTEGFGPPNDKNPKMIPGCCKHIYAVALDLISKGKL